MFVETIELWLKTTELKGSALLTAIIRVSLVSTVGPYDGGCLQSEESGTMQYPRTVREQCVRNRVVRFDGNATLTSSMLGFFALTREIVKMSFGIVTWKVRKTAVHYLTGSLQSPLILYYTMTPTG